MSADHAHTWTYYGDHLRECNDCDTRESVHVPVTVTRNPAGDWFAALPGDPEWVPLGFAATESRNAVAKYFAEFGHVVTWLDDLPTLI